MTLEDQVCSLELSKKLKELGAKQDAYFEWSFWTDHSPAENADCHEMHWEVTDKDGGNFGTRYSAFTVAELGKILYRCPEDILLRAYGHIFNVQDTHIITPKGLQILLISPNLLARMLIYLIENSLITL